MPQDKKRLVLDLLNLGFKRNASPATGRRSLDTSMARRRRRSLLSNICQHNDVLAQPHPRQAGGLLRNGATEIIRRTSRDDTRYLLHWRLIHLLQDSWRPERAQQACKPAAYVGNLILGETTLITSSMDIYPR